MEKMQDTASLPQRTLSEINQNRRKLLLAAYEAYPEFVYCDPEQFNWTAPGARTNLFDVYYLHDSGYVDLVNSAAGGRRRPDFYMLTPTGADLMEVPGKLDDHLPVV